MQRLKLHATDQSLSELKAIERNSTYTHTVRQRARALLHVAQGKVISLAAKMCGVNKESVRSWVHDFNKRGIEGICNTSGRRRNDGCAVDTPDDKVIRREGEAADAALKPQSDEQHETSGDSNGSNSESLAAISDAIGSTGTRGNGETVRQKRSSVVSTVQADTSVQVEVDDPTPHVEPLATSDLMVLADTSVQAEVDPTLHVEPLATSDVTVQADTSVQAEVDPTLHGEPLALSDVQVRQKANGQSPTTVTDGSFRSAGEASTGTLHVMTGASANEVTDLAVAMQVVRNARSGEAMGNEGAAAGGTLKQVQVIRCKTYVYDSEKDELSLKRTMLGSKIQDNIDLDLSSVTSFATSISKIVNNVCQGYDEVMQNEIVNSINNDTTNTNEKLYDCYLETERGRFKIKIPKSIKDKMTSTERIWSPSFMEKVTNVCTKTSYRDASDMINNLTERKEGEKISERTLQDVCVRESERVYVDMKSDMEITLTNYGIDSVTGEIRDITKLPQQVVNPELPSEDAKQNRDKSKEQIEKYNADHPDDKIDIDKCSNVTEYSNENCVYVSIDGVIVKKQKEHRKKEKDTTDKENVSKEGKTRKTIETINVSIVTREGTYCFTAQTIILALLFTMMYLLTKGYLINRSLYFLTDGAKVLHAAIKQIFGFREFHIILDWYHVREYCYCLFTMALIGGRKNKIRNAKIRGEFFNYVYKGDIEGAIKYLERIDKSIIKDMSKIEEIKDYLLRKKEYLCCYWIRKALGLKISSNRVEKLNDQVISQRCKHAGMSWSSSGIKGISFLRILSINHENQWFYSRKLNYNPVINQDKIKQMSSKNRANIEGAEAA